MSKILGNCKYRKWHKNCSSLGQATLKPPTPTPPTSIKKEMFNKRTKLTKTHDMYLRLNVLRSNLSHGSDKAQQHNGILHVQNIHS